MGEVQPRHPRRRPHGDTIVVPSNCAPTHPVLRAADPPTVVPWWGGAPSTTSSSEPQARGRIRCVIIGAKHPSDPTMTPSSRAQLQRPADGLRQSARCSHQGRQHHVRRAAAPAASAAWAHPASSLRPARVRYRIHPTDPAPSRTMVTTTRPSPTATQPRTGQGLPSPSLQLAAQVPSEGMPDDAGARLVSAARNPVRPGEGGRVPDLPSIRVVSLI